MNNNQITFRNPEDVAADLMYGLGCGHTLYGNPYTDYVILAKRGDDAASVSVIYEQRGFDGSPERQPWFAVHLVDDITWKDCELLFTETDSMEDLISLLCEIQGTLKGELS